MFPVRRGRVHSMMGRRWLLGRSPVSGGCVLDARAPLVAAVRKLAAWGLVVRDRAYPASAVGRSDSRAVADARRCPSRTCASSRDVGRGQPGGGVRGQARANGSDGGRRATG